MVAYCTEAQVQANMKGVTFGAATAVTSSALEDIIDEESAYIDAKIARRYALPIADATALIYLRRLCLALVIYRVTLILQPKSIRPTPDGNVEQDISTEGQYKKAVRELEALADGSADLPNEDKKSIDYISSTALNNDEECEFVHDEKQW